MISKENCGTRREKVSEDERKKAAITFLTQIIVLHEMIDIKLTKIEVRRSSISLHSVVLSEMPKTVSPSASFLEKNVLEIITLEQEVEALKKREPKLRAKMMLRIEKVDSISEQLVLVGHFLNRKSLEEIGREFKYSERYVMKLRRQGINRITQILEDRGELVKWISRAKR